MMNAIYKPCPYCMNDIEKKPILEKHQGEYSILCPYCLSHRSEWVRSIDEAIVSWNSYMQDNRASEQYIPEVQAHATDMFPPRYGTY